MLLATWRKELTHWKRSWCWERLKAGEEDDRGWGGWMASLTQWTWVWASSGKWWWTGKAGMLQSLGLQRVGHGWVTKLNWTQLPSLVLFMNPCGLKLTSSIFLGSKITADGDCSHEIKKCLLLGRKVMTNLDSILKSRDITLSTKVHLVKALVFPVVMYGCQSWTIKKAECWRIDAFELWCWRRLLRVPWTPGRSN